LRRFLTSIEDFGDDLPETGLRVAMGFAAYRNQFEVTGNELRYSREFIRRESCFPPDLRKNCGRCRELSAPTRMPPWY
jgi:hypothetical protein